MFKPARGSVEIATAKFAIAGYRNVIGIVPDNWLYIGVDVGDIATVIDVLATALPIQITLFAVVTLKPA